MFGLGVNLNWADLLELKSSLQFLDCLLDYWVLLVKNIDNQFRGVESESVCSRVISTELRGDCRDSSGSEDPIRGLTRRCVAKQIVSSAHFETVSWVALSENFFK